MNYSELQATSNFSFLRGGSHPDELVEQAAKLGYTKIAITDRNTLAGIVRAHVAAKKHGIGFIPACRLDLLDGPSLFAYPTDKEAYTRLSALLTVGNLRAEKGECHLYKADVYRHSEGIKFIIVPPAALTETFEFEAVFPQSLREYRQALGDQLYLGLVRAYTSYDAKKFFRIAQLSEQFNIPMVVANDVHYHEPQRRELQDVLTCVREKCTISEAGFKLHQNAERYLKPIEEMYRLFSHYPDALERTQEIADACTFSLDELHYVYPEEITPGSRSPMEELTHLTWEGAKIAYGDNTPEKTAATIKHELKFIEEMDYANYFLFVHDIVREARSRGILCQGRGSAANSAVCYCLGITSVDPAKFELLFERFISSAR
ncbi:MAG: PHP domain-containing protein, partial [Hymenobacter sp.]